MFRRKSKLRQARKSVRKLRRRLFDRRSRLEKCRDLLAELVKDVGRF